MTELAQALVGGILIGGLYVAISIGFSLSFGVLDVVDLARFDAQMQVGRLGALRFARVTCRGSAVDRVPSGDAGESQPGMIDGS